MRSSKAIRALIIVLLAIGIGATMPSVSSAQSAGWSRPLPLSSEGRFGWFPDVAVDVTGQIHVVWSSFAGHYDAVLYTTSKNGQEWSNINDIAAVPQVAGSEATRPGLFIDQYDLIHMTYRSTIVYYSQAPGASAYSANGWTQTYAVSGATGGQVAYFSRVARDRQGTLHLIFSENVISTTCPICFHLFYRRSEDNGRTWTPPVDISRLATGAAKPQLLIDGQDNLHLVWEAGRGGTYGQLTDPTRVWYSSSDDQGATWTSPVELSTELSAAVDGQSKDITIGQGRDGQLITAWLSLPEDKVYYRVSVDQGRSWAPPQPIPGVWGGWIIYQARLDDYAMATDSAGDVHMIMMGRTSEEQTSLSVLHLTWDDSNWSAPEVIATLAGDVPEWPRIAIGDGNQMHVVWFVRDQKHIWGDSPDGSPADYRIWYSGRASGAPEVVATPLPVPTAIPETQAAPEALTPSPAPTSNQLSASATRVDSTYNETDGVILLLQSLLPVVLLIVALLIGVRIRRR